MVGEKGGDARKLGSKRLLDRCSIAPISAGSGDTLRRVSRAGKSSCGLIKVDVVAVNAFAFPMSKDCGRFCRL